MRVRWLPSFALVVLLAGCANSTYSGSSVDIPTAISRAQAIVVGRIVTEEKRSVPENTFFTFLKCQVQVEESIRGSLHGIIPVAYAIEGDSPVPFHPGDTCIFFLELDTLPHSGTYQAQKVMADTRDNVAEVKAATER